jgi:hypothetical protein
VRPARIAAICERILQAFADIVFHRSLMTACADVNKAWQTGSKLEPVRTVAQPFITRLRKRAGGFVLIAAQSIKRRKS